jgi:hypothetical protein
MVITAENGDHLCVVVTACDRLPGVKFAVYSPLFCKKGVTHKISVLQEKQESTTVLRMANALRGFS